MNGTIEEVVSSLQLIPHPEGGYFRETYRSGATPMASRGRTDPAGALTATNRPGTERNELTSIIYMLTKDSPKQAMVSNISAHVHYWHAGASLRYSVVHPDGSVTHHVLGPNVAAGEQLQVRLPGTYSCVFCLSNPFVVRAAGEQLQVLRPSPCPHTGASC